MPNPSQPPNRSGRASQPEDADSPRDGVRGMSDDEETNDLDDEDDGADDDEYDDETDAGEDDDLEADDAADEADQDEKEGGGNR